MRKRNDIDLTQITEIIKLPHSAGLERKMLSLILKHDDTYPRTLKYLKPKGMFYDPINQKVWAAVVALFDQKRILTCENVALHFEGLSDKETSIYARGLWSEAALPSESESIALKLNEYWIQRTFIRLGHYVHSKATDTGTDQLDLLGVISDSTSKIYLHIANMKERTLSDAGSSLQQELISVNNQSGKVLGVPSSLSELNNRIKGYRKGLFIIVGASTGEGKTTFALQEAHYSVKNGIPEGYISLEMQTEELMLMMACGELNIPAEIVMDGSCTTDQLHSVLAYIEKIKKMPFMVTDKPGMRVGEIKAIAKMWKDKFGIRKLTIDHIHLANDDVDHNNPEQRFTNIANKLKELAKELDIPVVALAQLSRKDLTEKRVHQASDIKYAGGIEQSSDIVMLIFRPEHHGITEDMDGKSTAGFAKIIIDKLRMIKKQDVRCQFNGMSFSDINPFPNQGGYDNPSAGIRRTNFDETPF